MKTKGFTSTLFLNDNITTYQKRQCFNVLIENNFLGYDYESGNYIPFNDVLEKYPERPRYLAVYKNESSGISCAESNNFIICSIESDSKDSKIITSLTGEFCKITESSFAYIDNVGDSPERLEKNIRNKELRWLFKQNYFGRDFIAKYGKDFFLQMPCEKIEFISENIIRVELCKDIFAAIDKKLMADINNYLDKFAIKARYYNNNDFLFF